MPTQEYSELLHGLDDATLDRLVDAAGADADVPLTVVQIRHLGGALTRATAEDGPNGAIAEEYSVFCLGVPVAPGLPEAIEAAFGEVRTALGEQRAGGRSSTSWAPSPTSARRSPRPRAPACGRSRRRSTRPACSGATDPSDTSRPTGGHQGDCHAWLDAW